MPASPGSAGVSGGDVREVYQVERKYRQGLGRTSKIEKRRNAFAFLLFGGKFAY